jgi:hypothetical protein
VEALDLDNQTMHPLHFASDEILSVVVMAVEYRGGDFSRGPMPYAGGTMDQPALLMDAFSHVSNIWAQSAPKKDTSPSG